MLVSFRELDPLYNSEGLLANQPEDVDWALVGLTGLPMQCERVQWVHSCGRFRTHWNALAEVDFEPAVSTCKPYHATAVQRAI